MMAEQRRAVMASQSYTIDLRCRQCGAKGTAYGSDNDNGPNFSVDSVPEGFTHTHYSPNPWKQEFGHECGGIADNKVK
jgi:hypothetical protein